MGVAERRCQRRDSTRVRDDYKDFSDKSSDTGKRALHASLVKSRQILRDWINGAIYGTTCYLYTFCCCTLTSSQRQTICERSWRHMLINYWNIADLRSYSRSASNNHVQIVLYISVLHQWRFFEDTCQNCHLDHRCNNQFNFNYDIDSRLSSHGTLDDKHGKSANAVRVRVKLHI